MIIFKRITFQNFLSVGNTPVSIDLNTQKTTLIHGVNGSGKSTILDVLTYCLFGKSFRKVNLSQLINSINKKSLLAEVEFVIGKNTYVVRRGSKPKVFMILKNGEPLMAKAADKDNQQHLEQNILKLTYKSFTQIVILGSSNFVPFMQLPTVGRRECVEDFLDIKVFSAMAIIAKERLRGLKDRYAEMQSDISNLSYKCDLQRDRVRELELQSNTNIKEVVLSIEDRQSQVDKLKSLIESVQQNQKGVAEIAQLELRSNPQKNQKSLNNLMVKMRTKMDKLQKDIDFFTDNPSCPTCFQDIDSKIKDKIATDNNVEINTLTDALNKASIQMSEYEDTLRIVGTRQKHIESLQSSIMKYQTETESHLIEIGRMTKKLRDLRDDTSSVDKESTKVELMDEDLKSLRDKLFQLQQTIVEHTTVNNMLKDNGIKTQIVKKYLPVMNKCIRKYLTDLDFPIHFTLDNEFNESVSSPLHQNFSYSSFSEGQKGRIDLSLLFTWREIGKLKNSVSTNLLMLDEVFSSSLDEVGKECLLALIRYKLPDTNVFVIDHTLSQNFKDKFDKSIEVQRLKGFSHYN